jgi:hypothetical protein
MKKNVIIGAFAVAGITAAFLALKPKTDVSGYDPKASEPIAKKPAGDQTDTQYLDDKVAELQRENDELRRKAYEAETQKDKPSEPVDVQTKSPSEVAVALATAAKDMDMSPRGEGPMIPPKPVDTAAKAYTMAVESEIKNPGNSEEEDKSLLKKAALKSPSSTIASSSRAPEDRIHEMKGTYDGKLDFNKGGAGKLQLQISFERQADKSLGQFTVKIIDSQGKVQSDVKGNGSSIDLRSAEGSEALFLKVSPYEELQIFQKENGTLIGNYYERPKPGEELKVAGSFALTRL